MKGNDVHVSSLQEIKLSALGILKRLDSGDAGESQTAMREYLDLVDHFYQVSEHLAPQQYEEAKQDYEYFIRLLDLAILYYAPDES